MHSEDLKQLSHDIKKHLTVIKSEASLHLEDKDCELAKIAIEQVDEITQLINSATESES